MVIKWQKMGRIFAPSGEGFFKTHATRPIPFAIDDKVLRIFFSSRDHDDRMLPTYIDVELQNPSHIIGVSEQPLLQLGEPGTFDDSGMTLACVVADGADCYLYYTGWKRRRVVSFELSIGAIHWNRATDTYRRVFQGPIIGQDKDHPFLVAGPYVMHDGARYRMWYCSGTGWRFPKGNPEPLYTVFYAESLDGINWVPYGKPVIEYAYDGEVLSAPWVVRARRKYRMWYSTRGYKSKEEKNYTIGYAESSDGLAWQRMDGDAGITRSDTGWDSEMICYPAFHPCGRKMYMFYSGNGVGKGGLGYAVADNFLL